MVLVQVRVAVDFVNEHLEEQVRIHLGRVRRHAHQVIERLGVRIVLAVNHKYDRVRFAKNEVGVAELLGKVGHFKLPRQVPYLKLEE